MVIQNSGTILSLIITDDGIGFKGTKAGNGLVNMRQRAEDIGGNFTIESEPGKGTVISVHFPVHKILMPV